MFSFRTDMAHEAFSHFGGGIEVPGVRCNLSRLNGFELISVSVLDKEGEERIGKPIGEYLTLSFHESLYRGSDRFIQCVNALTALLQPMIRPAENGSYLIACLGNPDVTPDALGSLTASGLIVTRHMKHSENEDFRGFSSVSVCRPGVLGTSGVESAEQIASLCSLIHPSAVIVVDALAGSDPSGLCSSIQITDTGISPGSGVGNCREAISKDILGCPVFSIGVPTVIDAGMLSEDESLKGQFVCPRSIDSQVRLTAQIISSALNLALHPGLTFEDIQLLVG